MLYEPGTIVTRYCDIFPAKIEPWEAPLPVRRDGEAQSLMLRIIVTERLLTIGWQWGQAIQRLDLDIDPEEAATVSFGGGTVGKWKIGKKTGCRCNARLLAGWRPFPDNDLTDPATLVDSPRDSTWGLVPTRDTVKYSRPW